MKSLAKRFPLPLLLATTAVVFTACGGGGSSGFDIASLSEGIAIQRALDEDRCVERKGLTICPATEGGAPVSATPLGTPSPSPPGALAITTNLDHSNSLTCALQAADSLCNLAVQFAPRGFSAGAQFVIAARSNETDAPWTINTQQIRDAGNGALETPLNVPVQGLEIQVAVLVFDSLPASLPMQVAELSETGATFAYVTHVLMLSPTS